MLHISAINILVAVSQLAASATTLTTHGRTENPNSKSSLKIDSAQRLVGRTRARGKDLRNFS